MSAENVNSVAEVVPADVDAPTVTVSVKPGRQLRQSSLFDFPAFRPKSHLEVADDLLMPSQAPRPSIAPPTVGVVSANASGPVLVVNVGQGMGLSIPTLNNAVHYEATTPDGTTHSLRIGGAINPALPTQTVVVSHPSGITQSVTTVAQLQQEPRNRSGTKHTSLTYAQKLRALKMLRRGSTKTEVMEKFHIAMATLEGFVKHEKDIRVAIARGCGKLTRIRQPTVYAEAFKALFDRFVIAREMYTQVGTRWLMAMMTNLSEDFRNLKTKECKYRVLARFRMYYGLSIRRVSGITQLLPHNYRERMADFFDMLRKLLQKEKPLLICVMDETAVLWNPAAPTCVVLRGSKKVQIRLDDEKKMSTALLAASTKILWNGDNPQFYSSRPLDPVIFFKGTPGATGTKTVEADATRISAKYDCKCFVTANGWCNEEVMVKVCSALPELGGPHAGAPKWLFVDLFAAHRTEKVIAECKRKGYRVIFIPAGLTSKLQFHDVYVNRDFKGYLVEQYGALASEAVEKLVRKKKRLEDPEAIAELHAKSAAALSKRRSLAHSRGEIAPDEQTFEERQAILDQIATTAIERCAAEKVTREHVAKWVIAANSKIVTADLIADGLRSRVFNKFVLRGEHDEQTKALFGLNEETIAAKVAQPQPQPQPLPAGIAATAQQVRASNAAEVVDVDAVNDADSEEEEYEPPAEYVVDRPEDKRETRAIITLDHMLQDLTLHSDDSDDDAVQLIAEEVE